jgi:hypothetical protein
MAITISATCRSHLNVTETNDNPAIDPSNNTNDFNQYSSSSTIDASTTPPATKHTAFVVTLSAGSATIDLTSLPDSQGNAAQVTLLGLKIQKLLIVAPTTNANAITIKLGASNGHPFFTSVGHTLEPGQSAYYENRGVDVGTDVAAGDLAWDVTGTGSQTLQVQIVAG